MSVERTFAASMAEAGLTPPDEIVGDGRLHRFSGNGKRGDDAAWYVLHLDGVPAGAFGCWRTGMAQGWCSRREGLTAEERREQSARVREAMRLRDASQAKRRAEARTTAECMWNQAVPAIGHAYLVRKGVQAYGVRVLNGLLLIPMRSVTGELCSLQTITATGTKRFLAGGQVTGSYHAIGRPESGILVCEGYATGATLHAQVGGAVAVAFAASNLEPVACALRQKLGQIPMTIAADDDWKTPGNPGLAAATQAAKAVCAQLIKPRFGTLPRGARDTDFNDLVRLRAAQAPDRATA